MRKCEFCNAHDATHRAHDDWQLCDACYRARWRHRVLLAAALVLIVIGMAQTWQVCLAP